MGEQLRTLIINGPFTDAEVSAIVAVVREIEETRPEQVFNVLVDAPDVKTAVREFLGQINPLRPGYLREVSVYPREPGVGHNPGQEDPDDHTARD